MGSRSAGTLKSLPLTDGLKSGFRRYRIRLTNPPSATAASMSVPAGARSLCMAEDAVPKQLNDAERKLFEELARFALQPRNGAKRSPLRRGRRLHERRRDAGEVEVTT